MIYHYRFKETQDTSLCRLPICSSQIYTADTNLHGQIRTADTNLRGQIYTEDTKLQRQTHTVSTIKED